MKIIHLITMLSFQIIVAQTPSTDPHFYKIFEDDFNFIDQTKWEVWENIPWAPEYTNRPVNINTQNGILNLNVVEDNFNGVRYTGGLIRSQQSFSTGTYFECFSKIPEGSSFPAFWLFTGACDPPNLSYREIDIFEWFGRDNVYTANFHWCESTGRASSELIHKSANPYVFNKYAGFWNNDKTYIAINDLTINERNTLPIILKDPMKLINNNTLHGQQTDNVNPNFLPMNYQTDYIRVYRLHEDCDNEIIDIPNFSTYNYAIKKINYIK